MNTQKITAGLLMLILCGCGGPETNTQDVAARNPTSPVKAVTQDHYQTGIDLLKEGDVKQAVLALQKQVKEDPRDSRAFLVLGRIYINAGEQRQAQQVLNIAAGLNPESGEVQLLLAESYDKAQMPVKAMESAKKSVALYQQQQDAANFKRSVTVLRMLSTKYQKQGLQT